MMLADKYHPTTTHFWRALIPIALLTFLTTGCGDDRPELQPVSGSVMVNGVPAKGAIVTLHAKKPQPLGTPKPFARADGTGKFQFTTYSTTDGVPAGDYHVTVIWPQNPDARGPSPDRLSGRYANVSTTSLSVTIDSSTTQLPAFEFSSP